MGLKLTAPSLLKNNTLNDTGEIQQDQAQVMIIRMNKVVGAQHKQFPYPLLLSSLFLTP